jgi:hypothetical protein
MDATWAVVSMRGTHGRDRPSLDALLPGEWRW